MGIFTRPKEYLDPEIFDNNNVLLEKVRNLILARCYEVVNKEEISQLYMIGSIVGYKWEFDSDIDINVILTPESKGSAFWHTIAKETNGYILKGTKHPINLFMQDYRSPDWSDASFGVYNILSNKWEIPPESPTLQPNPFIDNKIDILFAKMRIKQVESLMQTLKKVYYEEKDMVATKQYLAELAQIYKELDKDRKTAYSMGWGIPRYSAENIIYKYLDKMGYLSVLEEIKDKLFSE